MNIGDHLTRAKYRMDRQGGPRVIGIILGKQEGRVLEICNTIETKYKSTQTMKGMSDEIIIDEDFTQTRIAAYKTMFPDLDPIGWYNADEKFDKSVKSDQPSENDIHVLKNVISKFAENPYLLVMNTKSQAA